MKKSVLLFALALALMSCDKDNENQALNFQAYSFKSIPVSELPANIKYHLQVNYPSASISSAEKDPSIGYEVGLSTGWEFYYDLNGSLLHKERNKDGDDDTPVAISSLPSAIRNYINSNYPGVSIVWAEWDDDEFEVFLSNGLELYFDGNGNFLYADADDQPIDPSSLPQVIRDYITQNYPNASIVEVDRYPNHYEIYLSNGIELYFDLNGNFLGREIDDQIINPADLPTVILDYIQQNYPNQSIVSAEIDDSMYEVELNNDLELYFDFNGNFLYADFD